MQKGGADGKPVSDQWLPPFVIVDDKKKPVGTVEDGDAVVCDIFPVCSAHFAVATAYSSGSAHSLCQA